MANLLTKKAKKKLKYELRGRQVVVALIFLIVVLLVGLVFNLSLWFGLKIQAQASNNRQLIDTKSSSSVSDPAELRNLESKINRLTNWWPEQSWSLILGKLQPASSTAIKINQMAGLLSPDNKTIKLVISGEAKSRQELVAFADELKRSKFFSYVDLPINSLLNEANKQFTINLELKNQ